MEYEDHLTLRQARARYFKANGFSEQGYDDCWIRFKLGAVPVLYPNSLPRRRAVVYHDLHHILAQYDTSPIGEAETAAWELGSGCRGYVAAWALDLSAVAMGLLLDKERVWRAFLRGRRCKNLYGRRVDEHLLRRKLGGLREELYLKFAR